MHASLSGLQWSVDAYTLVIGSLLMASGSTADRFGRRRVFQAGLALFTLGSLLCSLAPSVTALVIFRCVQALGGSMLNPVALSIVSNTFTERRARARAMGVWGAVFGISLALGPVLGGLLVTAVSLAGDLLDQHPDRHRRHHLDAAVRPRVQGGHGAPLRPLGPAACHRLARHADLRRHRGARARAGDRR